MYPIGMYCIWPDHDYIEKFIQAGGNTLGIVMCNFSLADDTIHDHYGHYFEVVQMLEKYHKDPRIKITLIPTLNEIFRDRPEDQCFHDGKKYLRRTPCPTSEGWIKYRLNPIITLCHSYNVDSVMFDVEHYNSKTDEKIITIWDGKWKPEHKCHCPRCKDLSKKEQWEIHHKLFKKYLDKIPLKESGQLAYFNMWNFDKYKGKKWLWTEDTYPVHNKPSNKEFFIRWKSHLGRKLWSKLFYGNDIHINAGLWIEKFKANDFIKWIEKYGKCSLYDGYWIYPQGRLSKYTRFKRDHKDPNYGELYYGLIDDPNAEASNPNFFLNLKDVNKEIKEYRDSWKFKLRKLLWI